MSTSTTTATTTTTSTTHPHTQPKKRPMPPATASPEAPAAKQTLEFRPPPPSPTPPTPLPPAVHIPHAGTSARRSCPCHLCAAVTILPPLTTPQILAIRGKIAEYEQKRNRALGYVYRRVKMLRSDWKRHIMMMAEGMDEKGQEYNERQFLIVIEQACEKWEVWERLGRRKEELERRLVGVTMKEG